MTNGEKFKEVFKISQVDKGTLYAFVMLPNHEVADISIDWWNAEYKEPSSSEIPTSSIIDWNNCHTSEQLESIATTKNDLGVDCISRVQAQTEIEMNAFRYTIAKERGGMGQVEWSDQLIEVSDAVDIIRKLPTVTPQEPRKGMRWIGRFETYEWGEKEEWCECPWCHMDSAEAYNFCPNCGADFREVKKSEDKE